mgnify:CR=1 FL=1
MNEYKTTLPFATVEKIMKSAGTQRISADAVVEMGKILEECCIKLTKEAIVLAGHANRITLRSEDIKLANSENKKK